MTLRSVLSLLVRADTYRRGVFLLLGGVILLPYVLLVAAFVNMFGEPYVPRPALTLMAAVSVVIVGVPPFLGGTRALEIAAVRSLLGVDLPVPAAGHGIDRETRLRSALWFVVHLVTGGVVSLGVLIAVPMALVFVAKQFGIAPSAIDGLRLGPLDEHDIGWLTLLGVVLLVGLGYLVAGLGALAAVLAPALLGPSQTERIAVLEARAAQLAERNRLARELHDSVGHALTVATLQAGVARELFDKDPEFARRALQAIEETSRRATADLDHVLGLLRERDNEASGRDNGVWRQGDETPEHDNEEPGRDAVTRAPQRTLADLDELVAAGQAAGLPVTVEVTGAVDTLPRAVSREGYRIVQEGLTNAARHGDRQSVTLRIGVRATGVEIDLVNTVPEPPTVPGPRRQGQGLTGMRERVLLLGGRLDTGPDDGRWRVFAYLPAVRPDDDPEELP
ncbi:sensor histidine kinase [Micromonospora sp. NPDC003197]